MAKSVNRSISARARWQESRGRNYTGGPSLAVNFSLATTDREKDRQGNWSDRTEWHNLVAFGRTAEIVRDYVSKGTQLFIQGKIQTRTWDDRESGQKRYRTEISRLRSDAAGRRPWGEWRRRSQQWSGQSPEGTAGVSAYQRQGMDEQYADEGHHR